MKAKSFALSFAIIASICTQAEALDVNPPRVCLLPCASVWFTNALERAFAEHPSIAAQMALSSAAAAEYSAELEGWRDPVATAAFGSRQSPDSAPLTTHGYTTSANAAYAGGNIQMPVADGVYGSVGVADGADNSPGGENSSYAGGMVRIPLLRDRGSNAHQLALLGLSVRQERAIQEAHTARENLGLEAFRAYAAYLSAVADSTEVSNAAQRAAKLESDATQRANLQDIAQYQVYPARYEASLRREEYRQTQQSIESARLELLFRLACTNTPTGLTRELSILDWAMHAATNNFSALAVCPVEFSAGVQMASLDLAEAHVNLDKAQEAARDSLDLNLGAGWSSRKDSDSAETFGYGVSIVYKRALGRKAEERNIEKAQYEVVACQSMLDLAHKNSLTNRDIAYTEFVAACERLRLSIEAVEAATAALESEDERFALGDGSSRNVLDAQKDLTSVRRRQLSIAADVVSKLIDLCAAVGALR